jgi:hypothetical protein
VSRPQSQDLSPRFDIYEFIRPIKTRVETEERVSFRFSSLTAKEWFGLLRPFLFFVCVGFVGRGFYPKCWWWSDAVFGLFDAVMIAGFVGIGLELYGTKFLIEKIADDLTEKLVGRGLPAKLQSHIREITKTSLVRERFVKTYSISEPQNHRVTLDIEVIFEVKNFSDDAQFYSPAILEETVFEPEFVYLEYGIDGEETHVFDAGRLTELRKIAEMVAKVEGPKKVKLPPVRDNPQKFCRVMWRYRITMPEQYSDETFFPIATMGAAIVLRGIHPSLEFVCSGEGLRHAENSQRWEFDRSFIKDQQMRVRWRIRDSQEPPLGESGNEVAPSEADNLPSEEAPGKGDIQ